MAAPAVPPLGPYVWRPMTPGLFWNLGELLTERGHVRVDLYCNESLAACDESIIPYVLIYTAIY
eukprot:2648672-Pleurochrysis_carterae.AAC.1